MKTIILLYSSLLCLSLGSCSAKTANKNQTLYTDTDDSTSVSENIEINTSGKTVKT